MLGRNNRRVPALVWVAAYLWSVPLVLFVSSWCDWQYDGDLAWWLAAAYTFPILMLTEPFSGSVPLQAYIAPYAVFLLVITAFAARNLVRARDGANGS